MECDQRFCNDETDTGARTGDKEYASCGGSPSYEVQPDTAMRRVNQH